MEKKTGDKNNPALLITSRSFRMSVPQDILKSVGRDAEIVREIYEKSW